MKMKITLLAFGILLGSIVGYAQTDASSLLKKMDATIFAIEDKTVNVKMVMLNLKSQKEKEKQAILMQKGTQMKLFRYVYPPSDSGIATLSLPNGEIYLYLPLFKKPKKITNLAESNTFNNSDFSIEDMATQAYSEMFTPTLKSSSGSTHVLELTPKTDNTYYKRVLVYMNKQNYYPEQFEFFDKKDVMVKKSVYHHVKVKGFWIADQVSMEDLKKKHKTTLYMSDIKLNQGLSDDLFTLENLVGEE